MKKPASSQIPKPDGSKAVGVTKEDVLSEILIWQNKDKKDNTQNQSVAEQIEETVKIITNKTKWQGKIREAVEFFKYKKPDLIAYFQERDIDPTNNICVLYLFLALLHDDLLRMNYIITDELKNLSPDLFSWTNYNAYWGEARSPLFWGHVKQDLETGKENIHSAKSKPLSKEAIQLYQIRNSIEFQGRKEKEYAEIMGKMLGRKVRGDEITRWRKQAEKWQEKTGLPIEKINAKPRERPIDPDKINIGKRKDGITARQQIKENTDDDDLIAGR